MPDLTVNVSSAAQSAVLFNTIKEVREAGDGYDRSRVDERRLSVFIHLEVLSGGCHKQVHLEGNVSSFSLATFARSLSLAHDAVHGGFSTGCRSKPVWTQHDIYKVICYIPWQWPM
jgi:hypothetical protein